MAWFTVVGFILVAQISSSVSASSQEMEPTAADPWKWNHGQVLDERLEFRIRWNNLDPEWLTLELSINESAFGGNLDYISLTFGPVHIHDDTEKATRDSIHIQFVNGELPQLMGQNNVYQILGGGKSNDNDEGRTLVRFRRKWVEVGVYSITDDTSRLSWEIGQLKGRPLSSGFASVSLKVNRDGYTPLPSLKDEASMKYWDATTKNVVNGETTIYLGGIVKFPGDDAHATKDGLWQIIGFSPLLGHPARIHHMVVFECHDNSTVLDRHIGEQAQNFFTDEFPPHILEFCSQYFFGWSRGGEGLMLPANTGLPVSSPYYLLQIHYDNPAGDSFSDVSGFRVYYTDHTHTQRQRQYNSSFFYIEHRVSMFHLIPPGLRSYKTSSICTAECTRSIFPASGLTVTTVQLHAHDLTTAMRVRHFRNGSELQVLASDDGYDPNYQQQRNVNPWRVILPGDELVVECEYDTRQRSKVTFGGIESAAEMCVAFLHYFPKVDSIRDSCNSQPEYGTFFAALGLDAKRDVHEAPILRAAGFPVEAENRSVHFPIPFDVPGMRAWTNSTELGEIWKYVNVKVTNVTVVGGGVGQKMSMAEYLRGYDWRKNGAEMEERLYGGKYYAFCPGVLLDDFITENPANRLATSSPALHRNKLET